MIVHRGENDHGGDGDRALPTGRRGVGGEGHGHRRGTGGLADHEAPPGQVAGPWAQAFAAVNVGPSRGRVDGSELGRGGGVAKGHQGRDGEPDQQAGPGSGSSRGEGRKHPCPDH